ncbi:MAG: MFS transporter [Propionibacteriales bacterium]|nr:MFS transporter [Propionibacteriales bacterium]
MPSSPSVDRLSTPIRARGDIPRRWPNSLAALEVRNYRLFLVAQVLGCTGGWMQRIAQDWMVLQLTGSVAAVGLTVALQFAPFLIFGLFGGVIADRYDKRKIMLITQSLVASCALVLGVLAVTGQVQVWHVYVIAFVLGTVVVIDSPARQVFVSELVGAQHIRNAVSLNSSVFQGAGLIGPAIAGILIGGVGLGWAFMINSVAAGLVVGVIAMIKPAVTQLPTVANRARGQLREGLAYIRRTSEVGWAIGLAGVAGVFAMNMPVVLSAFAEKEFQLGVGGYTTFNSLNAIGALTGALLSAGGHRQLRLRNIVPLLAGLGLLQAVASHLPSAWMFGAVLVMCGLTSLTFLIAANTLVQTTAAPAVRGRVMAVYTLVLMGGQAIGGPLLGWSMDNVGPRTTMLITGSVTAVLATTMMLLMARASRLTLSVGRPRWSDFHLSTVRLGALRFRTVTPASVRDWVPLHIVPRTRRRTA